MNNLFKWLQKTSNFIKSDYISKGSWKEDQIILQNCDLIVGPPSTFTMWASYISQIPLIKINSEKKYDFDNKLICKG